MGVIRRLTVRNLKESESGRLPLRVMSCLYSGLYSHFLLLLSQAGAAKGAQIVFGSTWALAESQETLSPSEYLIIPPLGKSTRRKFYQIILQKELK